LSLVSSISGKSAAVLFGVLQHCRPLREIGVRQCRNSEALDGFKIHDAIVVRVVGVLLFFVGLIGLVLFEKFVDHAKDADHNSVSAVA
jgi:hypothetical protein